MGTSLPVNLKDALDRLAYSYGDYCIWIDALCINQRDDAEKMQQVSLMGRIFSEAAEVLIWLPDRGEQLQYVEEETQASAGAEQEDDTVSVEAGLHALQKLADDRHFHELGGADECRSSDCPSIELASCSGSWRSTLKSLCIWMDVPWFQRTWTVQEVVLARHATLLCGSYSLPWATVTEAWMNWNVHMDSCCLECVFDLTPDDYHLLHRFSEQVLFLVQAAGRFRSGQDLLTALLRFRANKSSDDRDKIYGLLGLQSGEKTMSIRPDYTLSLRQVFVKTAADLMTQQGWLFPLHLELNHVVEGLPSWVPDWTYVNTDPSAYFIDRFEDARTYHAARGMSVVASVVDGATLIVQGLDFDTITSVSCAFRLQRTQAEELGVINLWRDFLDLESCAEEAYVAGGKFGEVAAWTMFADRFHDVDNVRQVNGRDFQAWQDELLRLGQQFGLEGPTAKTGLHPTVASCNTAILRRRLCRTAKGYLGLCPEAAEPGDDIFVLGGAPCPIFLRLRSNSEGGAVYTALGHGYLHGIMDGEAVGIGLPTVDVHIA